MAILLQFCKDLFTSTAFLGLCLVGGLIALQCGVATAGLDRCREIRSSVWDYLVRIGGGILALAVAQQYLGFRIALPW
jgi:hypothetical protein